MSEDWRISDAQRIMITDKLRHLSKKEAGLLFDFMQHCIFARRTENYLKEKGIEPNHES